VTGAVLFGPYVHDLDPIIVTVLGVHLWWYGLSYSLGFLNVHLLLRRQRASLGISLAAAYDLTLWLSVGVLVGGRLVVVNNEWMFYREHLSLIPAIWIGGLATHGLIIGGAVGVWGFCAIHRQPIRPLADALSIAAALILACGRIGNFVDGQIVGSITDLPWGVKFPQADGFRHPVVLYDGLKNFLLVLLLLWVRKRGAPPGRLAALFVFLYSAPRIPIDLLREYPLTLIGLPSGQTFNILMSVAGAILLLRNWIRRAAPLDPVPAAATGQPRAGLRWRGVAMASVLAVGLVIPSDATRDIPATYGHRHPGLVHTAMYPALE